MPKTPSTIQNIITLVTLRFFNEEVHVRDIAQFLGLSERQAREIVRKMIEQGLARESSIRGFYVIEDLTDKAVHIILRILPKIKSILQESVIKGVREL